MNFIFQKEKPEQKAEKKKPEAKKDAQEGDKKEKKSLSGGVFIEDLKVGSGPIAKPGKVVMVRFLYNTCFRFFLCLFVYIKAEGIYF